MTYLKVQFEGHDEERVLDYSDLPNSAPAHDITCHRAQGSQTRRVVIPLYDSKVLDPSWIYTAVTRGVEQVVLIGQKATLQEALANPSIAEKRTVGFCWPYEAK